MSTHGLPQEVMPSHNGWVRNVLLIMAFLIGMGSFCCLSPFFTGVAYRDDMVAGYRVIAGDSLQDAVIHGPNNPTKGGWPLDHRIL